MLHSAVTPPVKRRPISTRSSASCPAGVRANESAVADAASRIVRNAPIALPRSVESVPSASPVTAPNQSMPASSAAPAWSPTQLPTSHTAPTSTLGSGTESPQSCSDRALTLDVRVAPAGTASEPASARRSTAGDHDPSPVSPAGARWTTAARSTGAKSDIGST